MRGQLPRGLRRTRPSSRRTFNSRYLRFPRDPSVLREPGAGVCTQL